MKHLAKRTLSLLLAALMVLSLIPANPTHVHAVVNDVSFGYTGVASDPKGSGLTATSNLTKIGANGTTFYGVYALKTNLGFSLTDKAAFLDANYNGNVTVTVEYLSDSSVVYGSQTLNFTQDYVLKYPTTDGTWKTATPVSVVDSTLSSDQGTVLPAKVATYRLYDVTLDGTRSGVNNLALTIEKTGTATYFPLRSVKISKRVPEVFFDSYTNYLYDDEALTDFTIDHLGENDAPIYVRATITKDEQATDINDTLVVGHQTNGPGTLTGSETDFVIGAANQFETLLADTAKYAVLFKVYYNGTSGGNMAAKTYNISHVATFEHELDLNGDGDLVYKIKKDATNGTHAPTVFNVIVSNGVTTWNKLFTTGVVYGTEEWTELNLSDLAVITERDPGTYTVTVKAYDNATNQTLRATDVYENYVVGEATEPEVLAPVFNYNDTNTVYDSAAIPALTVNNPNAEDMTVTITATISKDGEAIVDATDLTLADNVPISAGSDPSELLSADLLNRYMAGNGQYEIALTGEYVVGEDTNTINETLNVTRTATFEHELGANNEDNVLTYSVKKLAGYEDKAPSAFRITIKKPNNETKTKSFTADEMVSKYGAYGTDAFCNVPLSTAYESDFAASGTYTVTVEAGVLSGSKFVVRETIEETYTVACKHVGETEVRGTVVGDCGTEGYSGDTYCLDCGNKIADGENTGKDSSKHVGETEVRGTVVGDCGTEGYTGDTWCTTCNTKIADGENTGKDSSKHVGETEVRGTVVGDCGTEGYTGDTWCTTCNTKIADGENTGKDSSKHVGETEVRGEIEATCKTEGYTGDTWCTTCNTKIADGENTGKDSSKHVGETEVRGTVVGDCGTEGYTGDTWCTTCNTKIADGENTGKDSSKHVGETEVRGEIEATCKTEGYTGDTWCTTCNTKIADGEATEVNPENHNMQVTTPRVPAECGKAGTEAVYTCANGCDHTEGGEEIPALEHEYADEHDKNCDRCGYIRAIDAGNVDLGNTMDYNVYVTLDPEKAEDAYAVIKKNGVVVEDDAKLEENGGSYEITLPGLAAKELCEGFTVEIYDKDGNKIGEAEESFAAYATRLFTKSSNEAAKRMIADMIVYATKAQQHFGYKTNDLLANQIDENLYKNYVTNYSEENVADRVVTQESKYYFGTNFELEKNISMNMFVANIEGGYGVFSFTDGEGNTKYEEQRINADNEKMSGDYYIFNINKFVTADGHDVTVTARFYDANGTLVATVSDSMASYVARMNDQYPWLEYMMTFATSTYNYKSSK